MQTDTYKPMQTPTSQLVAAASKSKLPSGIRIFLQELVNCAAVKAEAHRIGREPSFSISSAVYADGIERTAAILLSLHHGVSVNEIEDEADRRAKEIFQTGQDWRREVKLFTSHVNFNQD